MRITALARVASAVSAVLLLAVWPVIGRQGGGEPPKLDPGVTLRVYQVSGTITRIPMLEEGQTPNVDELRATVNFTNAPEVIRNVAGPEGRDSLSRFPEIESPIVCVVKGWIEISGEVESKEAKEKGNAAGDAAKTYVFRLTSDDGSRLFIDDREVINHDARHGATAKESAALELAPGQHPFRIDYFDSGGRRRLLLEWKTPGAKGFVLVPTKSLWAEPDLARVTSPGVKRIVPGSGEGEAVARTRPGDRRPVEGVHPAFKIETIRTPGLEPRVGAMCFDSRGRLIVGTFDPLQRTEEALPDIDKKTPDKLYAIDGVLGVAADANGFIDGRVSVAADGLFEPCGLCIMYQSGGPPTLYVSHRRAVTRLIDQDGDGFYETHEDLATGWEGWNYHQFNFGMASWDGKLYCALATAMAPPKWEGMGTNAAPNGPMRGCIVEIDPVANIASVIAGGSRTPNGIAVIGGHLYYCDNQGTWMPTSQMSVVVPGYFLGHFNNTNVVPQLKDRYPDGGAASAWCDRVRAPATLYLPQNECSNSPTQPVVIDATTAESRVNAYNGHMLIGELTAGGIRRAVLEEVNGTQQGVVFQFSQGFNVGINRMVWAPATNTPGEGYRGGDNVLYVGGIGAGGNWNWKETKFGLQRLVPTGVAPFEMHAVRATPKGLKIVFTKAVASEWLSEVKNYEVRQWGYTPTAEYGGPKINDRAMRVTKATPSDDGREVSLEIPGLEAGSCVYVHVDPKSVDGDAIWSTEAWYTLNQVPRNEDGEEARRRVIGVGVANPVVQSLGVGAMAPADGVVLIGRSAKANFVTPATAGKMPVAAENRTQRDLLAQPEYIEMKVEEGDLTSRTSFGDALIHVEWYCPPGGEGQMAGNSGVYLQSLYEIQVLGTLARVEPKKNEAGAIYNVKAPDVNASTGPGTWQAYDILFVAPKFEKGVKKSPARLTMFWNGVKVHDDVAIEGPTGAAAAKAEPGPPKENGGDGVTQVGPLRLQAHATAAEGGVRFRNVWIAPLEPEWDHSLAARWCAYGYQEPVVEDVYRYPGRAERPSRRFEDLNDWVVRGGNAEFHIENGELVGETRPNTPNTFLVTKSSYRNFELIVEVKQDPALNSGVQFRSRVEGGIDNRSGRVIGYQCELDPSSRAFSGGIYDEGRRGWLVPLIDAPYARVAYKPGEWNTVRIVAKGAVVQTWVNGVPAATMFDAMDASGHIAFQVHGVGEKKEPLQVRFRNLWIRSLDRPEMPPGRPGVKE